MLRKIPLDLKSKNATLKNVTLKKSTMRQHMTEKNSKKLWPELVELSQGANNKKFGMEGEEARRFSPDLKAGEIALTLARLNKKADGCESALETLALVAKIIKVTSQKVGDNGIFNDSVNKLRCDIVNIVFECFDEEE